MRVKSVQLSLLCVVRQYVSDWLALVSNAACADKPDHIRHNAVSAIRMAAPSVVNIARGRCRADDGWNVLALRSGICHVQTMIFFMLLPTESVGEGIIFSAVPLTCSFIHPFIRPFVQTDIVTKISHERLE